MCVFIVNFQILKKDLATFPILDTRFGNLSNYGTIYGHKCTHFSKEKTFIRTSFLFQATSYGDY